MNLATLYRDHPDLAMLVEDARAHLVSCHDCGHHYLSREMHHLILDVGCIYVCDTCFERRQDVVWAEWQDRLAKEGREGA